MDRCRSLDLDWGLYYIPSLASIRLTVASYAELGSAIPLEGGPRAYLSHSYGPFSAFLFSWTTISAAKPGSSAVVSTIFAKYINRVLFSVVATDSTPLWADKILALVSIWAVVTLNALGWGTTLNNVFTVLKVTTLASIAGVGLLVVGWTHP